ncbi:uncharacterized protein LAESUDRAFT_767687 [Laetiporus sulphureus 93-53]|uniref:Protein-lysine N-methyltransferase EFM6 n=1 Tax=Laetiporus sulphureus 93-53 TaxID=1314785 RepID=A0A165IJ43_9APHY|nr:uncharacterized protein LAESUDRAFT_767687 [Laetiporus sulphureus 93-53]KZT13149.1 hypothetical protein LAESUDRAFT_767687 [Laetiporus sulphureus 93-53]
MKRFAHVEKLDALDPLRHLRNNDVDVDIVPAQPPSIINQTTQLVFPTSRLDLKNSHHAEADMRTPEDIVINLSVDASPGCGGIAWPAGEVLSRYLARRGSLRGRVALELGSGTGLVGLVAGILGADVWITDQAPLLPIMTSNVALNGLSSRVRIAELNWGTPLPADLPAPDLVLAADCVYFEPAFPLLVGTLAELVPKEGKDVEVLFCYKKRRKADKRFFTLLKKEFTWTEVTDDPDHAVYSREAISLLRLTRRR